MEKDTLQAFKLFSRFTESNRQLIFFGIIVGLLAIAFISSSHQIPIVGVNASNETYINASRIESVGLASSSGNNTALISGYDNNPWIGNESNTPFKIDITFWNVSHFDYKESVTKYFSLVGSATQDLDVEIWCTNHNEFMDINELTIHNEWQYYTRNFPNSSHFIQPNGTVWIRVNHTSNGNTNHRIYIDASRLIIRPQFERINVTNNTYITNGTTDCTVNCSFDKIYVNTITKNDTTDAYGSYINLTGTGFTAISIVDNIKSRFTLNDGSFFDIISEYIGGSNKSEIFGNPDLLELVVSNGSVNVIDIYHNRTEQIIDSRTYKTNSTHMDYGGANITNLNNTNITGYINITNTTASPLPERVALMDGNGVFVYNDSGTFRTQLSTNGIQEWNLRSGASNVGYVLYSTPADGTTSFPGILFRNATQGQRTEMELSSGGLRFRASATSSQNPSYVQVNTSGNLYLNKAGGGITLLSPDGNDWCVTVTNAGALTVSSTPCG